MQKALHLSLELLVNLGVWIWVGNITGKDKVCSGYSIQLSYFWGLFLDQLPQPHPVGCEVFNSKTGCKRIVTMNRYGFIASSGMR